MASVYPNPAHGVLQVEGRSSERKPWVARLYTATGQAVAARVAYEDKFSLNINGLQPGVYVLRLFSGAGVPVLTQKVLVE